jgi:hypothetical protein
MIRTLSNCNWVSTGNKPWKYKLVTDFRIEVREKWSNRPELFVFISSFGGVNRELGRLHNGIMTLRNQYASDGATCAPDIKSMFPAIFTHDIGCQFCDIDGSPFTRYDIDCMFYQLARKTNPLASHIYFAGVRFGARLMRSKPSEFLKIKILTPQDEEYELYYSQR